MRECFLGQEKILCKETKEWIFLDFLETCELFTVTREKGLEGNSGQELSCNAKSGLHGIFELPSMLSNFSSIIFLKGGREVSSVKCYPILFLLL